MNIGRMPNLTSGKTAHPHWNPVTASGDVTDWPVLLAPNILPGYTVATIIVAWLPASIVRSGRLRALSVSNERRRL